MSLCDDVDLILAVGAVSGGWEPDEARLVREHTSACTRCSGAAAGYLATAGALALAPDPVEPSPMLRTRIMAQVYGSLPATTRTAQEQPHQGLRTRLASLWRGVPQGRGLTLGGAAAALAAVGLLVWSVGSGRQATGGSPAPLSASVHGSIDDAAVHGTVTVYRSTSTAVLSVRGLPAQPGHVYEVWLVRADNTVKPAGFLVEQPDGTWSTAMQGSMQGFSLVAATVERPGGSATPTGQMVLEGSLPGA